MSPAPADAPIKAILFDVDGTLLTTGGAGAVAWSKAFDEVHGVPVDIEKVTESGMTDSDVATKALSTVLDREPTDADDRRGHRSLPQVPARCGRELGEVPDRTRHRRTARATCRGGLPARHDHRQHRTGSADQAFPR